MGCGAVQFPSTTTDSKHHNLTFHSGCNVLYHPSTSSITLLIWLLPQNPKSHFPFFLISLETLSLHRSTKWRRESSRAERDAKLCDARRVCVQKETQSDELLRFFFSSTILSHPLSLWFCLHIIQLFFLVFFWYNILLFDSLFIFVWWWRCNRKAKLDVLDSLLRGTELQFYFSSFHLFDLFFLIYKF
jgi:hypothetical protein